MTRYILSPFNKETESCVQFFSSPEISNCIFVICCLLLFYWWTNKRNDTLKNQDNFDIEVCIHKPLPWCENSLYFCVLLKQWHTALNALASGALWTAEPHPPQ